MNYYYRMLVDNGVFVNVQWCGCGRGCGHKQLPVLHENWFSLMSLEAQRAHDTAQMYVSAHYGDIDPRKHLVYAVAGWDGDHPAKVAFSKMETRWTSIEEKLFVSVMLAEKAVASWREHGFVEQADAYALAADEGRLFTLVCGPQDEWLSIWKSGCKSPVEKMLYGPLREVVRGRAHLVTQYPMGPVILDFAVINSDHKIAIEVDGHDFHERTKEQATRDRSRDRALTADGWVVLRFTGSEVYRGADACAREVSTILSR